MNTTLWQAVSSDYKKGQKIGVMRGFDHDSYQFVRVVDNDTADLVGQALIHKTFATAGEAIDAIKAAIRNARTAAGFDNAIDDEWFEQLDLGLFHDVKRR